MQHLEAPAPRRVEVCTLLDRPARRIVPIDVRYVGVEIPDVFVLGYGLHHADRYRNLPRVVDADREVVAADPDAVRRRALRGGPPRGREDRSLRGPGATMAAGRVRRRRVIPMSLVGVRVEVPTNQPIVLLRENEGQRYLPIFIGPPEATAIVYALQGMETPRPMTHDLFKTVLEDLGARSAGR